MKIWKDNLITAGSRGPSEKLRNNIEKLTPHR